MFDLTRQSAAMRVYHTTAILLITRAAGVTSEKTKAQEKVDSGGLEPPKPLSERLIYNQVHLATLPTVHYINSLFNASAGDRTRTHSLLFDRVTARLLPPRALGMIIASYPIALQRHPILR